MAISEGKKKLSLDDIKRRIKIVCICKGIKQGTICDAILQGCTSIAEVNKKTGSGSGGCKGVRCSPVIQTLIDSKGRPLAAPHTLVSEDDDNDDDHDEFEK